MRAMLAVAVLCPWALLGAVAPPEVPEVPAPEREPRIRKVGPHFYEVGLVLVDARERTARCPGRVNMDEGGPIELLACLPSGKTHESVFTLDVAAADLQVALLLLDMQPGRNPAVDYPEDSPEREKPPADRALIFVEWAPPAETAEPPAPQRSRAESFLYNVAADSPMAQATWAFLGSRMVEGRFGADLGGSLITTYHDPLAVLELALPTVNDDIFYFVHAEHCPPVGTPVDLIIQPLPPAAAQEPAKRDERSPEGPLT
ncbi:MAG: YdjY domain-containing protein [Planctomycetota bacterium]